MNPFRRPVSPGLPAFGACLALTVTTLLNACAPSPPAEPASTAPVYAIDLTGGAKHCEVSKVTLVNGKQATAAMTVGNDGGWCGISVARPGPTPYAAGLLTAAPTRGKVVIHTVGDATRIDYTPPPGFTGMDGFTVELLPGHPSLHVTVMVTRT